MLAIHYTMKRIARPIVQCVQTTLHVLHGYVVVSILPIQWTLPVQEVEMASSASSALLIPEKRTKALAKTNEEQDIGLLVRMLNAPEGETLRRLYSESFPGEIVRARTSDPADKKKAGGRSAHYDFQVLVLRDGVSQWLRVEHKGSQICKPIDEGAPWTGGVQFFNGGMEKYRLCRRYAEAWYARYIGSGFLSAEYEVKEPIPTCEEWIQRDARVQGDPKTPWGKALKRAVRARGQDSLRHLRDAFVPDFVNGLTGEDREAFLDDVTPILRDSLAQKDVWLQIAGSLDGKYYARWSPALSVSDVTDVHILGEKDVTGFISSDCQHPIRFILRWGKGAGFSNLRLDLK